MPCFWSRKDKRKGALPPPPASRAVDLGLLIQERGPKAQVEDAGGRRPAPGDPKEEFVGFCRMQHPEKGQGLSRFLWLVGHEAPKQRRDSQETLESRRGAGMQGQAAKRCTQLKGKAPELPEKPGTHQKVTRGGEAQQKEEAASVMVVKVCNGVPHLEENGWDEPMVGHEARDVEVPRGGGGHGGERGPSQVLVQAEASRNEEGRTTRSAQSLGLQVEDKADVPIPGGNRDRENLNPPSAEGRCGEEQRRQVWEKLQRLGEDMEKWEGRSTRELAVRLVEVILQTKISEYPTGTRNQSELLELGQGGARGRVGSSEEVGALVDTHVDVTMMQHYQPLEDLAGYHDMYWKDHELLAMMETSENEQIWEDSDDDDLLEQGGPPPLPRPTVAMLCLRVQEDRDKEQWKEEFPDVWAQYETDCGLVSGAVTVSGAWVPFQQQPRFPAAKEQKMASILQALLRDGVVVKGRSSSNSPVRLVQKADWKTCRLVLDCRAINEATPKVVASVDLGKAEILANLSPKSRYFSKVDLSSASFAIPLAVSSRAKFAFTFWGQQYLFTRLPVGFHSTTPILHQRVKQMLSQLAQEDQPWVFSYSDDILISGETRKATEDRTRAVLKLIQKTGFKAKLEKAQLVQPKVTYLGMTIGAKGWKVQTHKLEAVIKASRPENIRSLRLLLGKLSAVQDHIPNYWKLAWPLQRLLMGQVRWAWGQEQEKALNRLKGTLWAAPILRFPDRTQPFVIRLTTSKKEVGATLLQEDRGGRLVPVRYTSRMLKGCAVSYLTREKRCLAAIWAVEAFKTLTGSAPILIQMPQSPWKYLLRGEVFGSCRTNPSPAQWSLLLVNKGAAGGMMGRGPQPGEWGHTLRVPISTAPSLKELPSDIPKANVWFLATQEGCSTSFAAANLEERWLLGVAEEDAELVALGELLRCHQGSSSLYLYTNCLSLVERLQGLMEEWEWDPESWATAGDDLWSSILWWVHNTPQVLRIRYLGGHGSMDPEEKKWSQKVDRRAWKMSTLAVGNQLMWEPSRYEKQEIIARCHSWKHEGVEETLARVQRVVPWEGDSEQVARWVQRCPKCAAGRDGGGRMQPQRAEGPWSQLWLGHIKGLPESEEGARSLLVVEDKFSGWVDAFPLWEGTVQEMAWVLYEKVFERYGTPRMVYLPQVPRWLQDVPRLVMSETGLKLLWTTLQPNQEVPATQILQRLAWGAGKAWVEMLPLMLAGVRALQAPGEVLDPYQIISGFPLEVRWGCEEASPNGNVLLWLRGLQEEEDGYKQRTKAALLEGCLEGNAP
ncbi:scavenger receptor class a member 3 [Limosa lapponica baueri]|uniref:Gypsy retrotransposon integrase-like protein 1 n=1 Tax=Limosa lapponica baueri TaxID=1758121 RepID=A0A2I0T8H8_LIMLA|nr:scavenger receptor class a member 3 [Limosa lapponica baueri]